MQPVIQLLKRHLKKKCLFLEKSKNQQAHVLILATKQVQLNLVCTSINIYFKNFQPNTDILVRLLSELQIITQILTYTTAHIECIYYEVVQNVI